MTRYYVEETCDGETFGSYFEGSLLETIEAITADWRSSHILTTIRNVETGVVVYQR
jgi:hypothetical protein